MRNSVTSIVGFTSKPSEATPPHSLLRTKSFLLLSFPQSVPKFLGWADQDLHTSRGGFPMVGQVCCKLQVWLTTTQFYFEETERIEAQNLGHSTKTAKLSTFLDSVVVSLFPQICAALLPFETPSCSCWSIPKNPSIEAYAAVHLQVRRRVVLFATRSLLLSVHDNCVVVANISLVSAPLPALTAAKHFPLLRPVWGSPFRRGLELRDNVRYSIFDTAFYVL